MRISLLLRREPFGEILAETLTRYWSERTGREYVISWDCHRSGQRWWGNSYLNCFSTAGTSASVFGALRREYSRAPSWWKRPAQLLYVFLGTRSPTLRLLSNVKFSVSPDVAEAGSMLVVGGNHRIRLLHPGEQRSVVILKSRFDERHLANDVQVRQLVQPKFAPALLNANTSGSWLEERYVVGVPTNRMSPTSGDPWRKRAVMATWREVVLPTISWVPGVVWRDRLLDQFRKLIACNQSPAGEALYGLARELGASACARDRDEIPMSWTHGDLQDANILAAAERFWVIDWESAALRFAAYDFHVLSTGARRQDPAWAHRCAEELTGRDPRLGSWLGAMRELRFSDARRKPWACAFLLEELWFRAADAAEPAFFSPGADWPTIVRDVTAARVALG